jgi:hypothetical protein
MSKLSFQSALITAVAIAGFAVGRSYPWPASPRADDRAYYVKALEYSLKERREATSRAASGSRRI